MSCLAAEIRLRALTGTAAICNDEDPMPPSCSADRVLRVVQGTDWTVLITVFDADDNRLDLTLYEVTFHVAAAPGSTVLIAKSTTGGGVTRLAQSGDTLGQAEVAGVPADTALLTPAVMSYEVRVVGPTSAPKVESVIRPSDFVLYAGV